MRPIIALALVLLAACGRADRTEAPASAHDAPSSNALNGPDPLILRVPRGGGTARVTAYTRRDSVIWQSSSAAPALQRVLAFDPDAGIVAYLDRRQGVGRIDLRLGDVGRASPGRLKVEGAASVDGTSIFGIAGDTVVRFTPSGSWKLVPPRRPTAVYPLRDGSVLVLGERGEKSVLWKVRPPGREISDTLELPHVVAATTAGDQLFLALDGGVAAVRTRTMELQPPVAVEGAVRALAPTPSGDRLFVLAGDSATLTVIDRYQARVERTVELPAAARALRMDPLGRYLLVRAARGDSVLVVAIGTGAVLGALTSAWRDDLPFVAADGAVALAQGGDVVFADGETLRGVGRVAGGAGDFWFPFYWTGFRPRDAALDRPATFPGGAESALAVDSGAAAQLGDTASRLTPPGTSLDPGPAPDAPPAPTFYVQVAAVSTEAGARTLAQGIHLGNASASVVPTQRDGRTLYRVVLGPYPSRVAAENAGRATGRPFYIIEGSP